MTTTRRLKTTSLSCRKDPSPHAATHRTAAMWYNTGELQRRYNMNDLVREMKEFFVELFKWSCAIFLPIPILVLLCIAGAIVATLISYVIPAPEINYIVIVTSVTAFWVVGVERFTPKGSRIASSLSILVMVCVVLASLYGWNSLTKIDVCARISLFLGCGIGLGCRKIKR